MIHKYNYHYSQKFKNSIGSYKLRPPSPEVTELFCQIPSTIFFHRFSILDLPTGVGFYVFYPFKKNLKGC